MSVEYNFKLRCEHDRASIVDALLPELAAEWQGDRLVIGQSPPLFGRLEFYSDRSFDDANEALQDDVPNGFLFAELKPGERLVEGYFSLRHPSDDWYSPELLDFLVSLLDHCVSGIVTAEGTPHLWRRSSRLECSPGALHEFPRLAQMVATADVIDDKHFDRDDWPASF